MKVKKVCIVAYYALPVIDPTVMGSLTGSFGGLETCSWLIARGLARRADTDVTFIVRHHRKRAPQVVDGVNVVTRWEPLEIFRQSLSGKLSVTPQFPWLHFHRWDSSLLWKIPLLAAVRPFKKKSIDPTKTDPFFENLGCDIYCAFGVNAVSASVIASAKQLGADSILSLQSMAEIDANYVFNPDYRGEYGELGSICLFALQEAETILSQTEHQAQCLKERFHRDSVLLGNPFDTESWDQSLRDQNELPFPSHHKKFALWIGRSDRFHKRPLMLIEIARRVPHIPFVMILNGGDQDVREEIEQTKPDNVQIVNYVPFHLMPAVFARSFVFVTTSSAEHEGLPNVFLQAAATNVPIVSIECVPGDMLRGGFAFLFDSIQELVKQLDALWKNQDVAHQYGLRGREYIQNNSDIDMYAEQISKLF